MFEPEVKEIIAEVLERLAIRIGNIEDKSPITISEFIIELNRLAQSLRKEAL